MSKFEKITVKFLGNITVTFKNVSLEAVVKKCLSFPYANHSPLLITFSTGKKMYFNTSIFLAWLNKEINLQELVSATDTDFLFRNIKVIKGVDPGALWFRQNNQCILADDDVDIRITYDTNLFETLADIED